MNTKRKFVVSGNIGVGKTTLCNNLQNQLGCPVCYENPEGNPFLPLSYSEPEKYFWSSQLFFTHLRIQSQLSFAHGALDRWISEDEIFVKAAIENGHISKEKAELYFEHARCGREILGRIDFIIFLKASPEICESRMRDRIRKRSQDTSQDYESGVSLGYLKQLDKYYKEYITEMVKEYPVFVVNWETPSNDAKGLISKIENVLRFDPEPKIHTVNM